MVLSATVLSYIFLWLVMGGYGYMDKIDVVKKIQDIGVVAVIRGKDAAEAIAMSDACIRGGA